ncbi:MAG: galactokinase [Candidatus Helarchaeota archaeon]
MDIYERINKVIKKLQVLDRINNKDIRVACAPGRINLIGEHTDYNEGYVFPCAVSRENIMAAVPTKVKKIKICSLNYNEVHEFSLENKDKTGTWIDYIKGVIQYLTIEGYKIDGITGVLHSTVPIGGGLSSSAALEVVSAFIFSLLFNLEIDLKELALICYKAERYYMDITCGIMDQFISTLGEKNSFLFLDCRPPYFFERIKLPRKDIKLVIMDTKVHRAASSVLNVRMRECKKGVDLIQNNIREKISALRDVSIETFEKIKNSISQPIRNRCKHVIYENERVIKSKQAIKTGNLQLLGDLLYESHESLDQLYEVSSKELNVMVKIASEIDGVIGARMTGAGLGGCAICLCYDWATDEVIEKVKNEYEKETGIKSEIYSCKISDGVKEMKF